MKIKEWLQSLSFRTGVIVLMCCIPFYILSFAQMLLPIVQDWCHRPDVLHTLLYPVLCPDAAAYQYNSKRRALGCALRTGQDLPVWRSDHSGC